jgi:orotate phosphoribosyltransferase
MPTGMRGRFAPVSYAGMAEPADTESLLRAWGTLLADDHFVYISGQHGSGWIDKDAVYPHTERTSQLAARIAASVAGQGIEIVCGPATGGLIIAQWVAHHLGALAVFGEHGEASPPDDVVDTRRPFILKRGYERLVRDHTVLVVDDVINTGYSIRGIIDAVRLNGGSVPVAAAVCNRGALTADQLGVDELISLADIRLGSWPPKDCPLCRSGIPVNTHYAHGSDYVSAGGNWP